MKEASAVEKDILRTREAAELLKVTPQTIKNYIYAGKLKALRTPGGHHRIRRSDLKEIGMLEDLPGEEGSLSRKELYQLYRQLLGSYVDTIKALLKAIDARDSIELSHSLRVAEYCKGIAQELGLPDAEKRNLELAALLHDVGKIGISENILGKPGQLTDQEHFMVKQHSEIGEDIIGKVDFLKPIAASVRHHHERFDGKGYPDGLALEEIPLPARIISVAETYDFLTTESPFKQALSKEQALEELQRSSGKQLDPEIVNTFVASVH
jgi:excisionase family DNA binding protein/putative nucleotidyltransferase with HDIG domain